MRRPVDRRRAGYTLIELIIAMALMGILAIIGFPALLNMIARARHESFVRETAASVRAARLEAIKKSTTTYVWLDGNQVVTSVDTDGDGAAPATDTADDEELRRLTLPNQLIFAGPPADSDGINFGGTAYAEFDSRGAAGAVGGLRVTEQSGQNHFEVRVDPIATARVTIRKWNDSASLWKEQGEDGVSWEWY